MHCVNVRLLRGCVRHLCGADWSSSGLRRAKTLRPAQVEENVSLCLQVCLRFDWAWLESYVSRAA